MDGIDNLSSHRHFAQYHARSFGQICQQNGELHSIKNENYYESDFRRFLIYCSDDNNITMNLKTQAQCLPFSIKENQEQGAV